MALASLASVWSDANEPTLVNRASNLVDQVLLYDAQVVGTPAHEGLRRLNIPPLTVLFDVDESRPEVEVVSLRQLPSPMR